MSLPKLRTMLVVAVGWGAALLAVDAQAALGAPAGLNAASLKATSFTLKWSAATGGTGGIAGYDVYGAGVLLGTTITRSFAITGLAPLTTYTMTVIARDGAGNVSPSSAALAVTTAADTTDPSKPADLSASAVTTSSFTLSWSPSSDNVGVTGYEIYRAGDLVGTSVVTSFPLSGLAADTNHRMTVKAVDAAGNVSGASAALVVRTLAEPPSAPTGLTVANLKAVSFTLKWLAATGGTGGIAGYEVYRDGSLLGTTTTRSFVVTGLAPETPCSMTVTARDEDGRVSPPSAAFVVTTAPDTTRPAKPTDLVALYLAPTSFTLGWTAATDAVGVTSYNIYRAGVLVGSSKATTFRVTGLAPSSVNKMTVKAADAAGNLSGASAALSVTTLSAPPNQPPVVTLTAPADGATLSVGLPFTLRAQASDPDGTVAKVEFYDGTAKLGETGIPAVAPATYTLVFTPVAGAHSLTAMAYDNAGAHTTTLPVHVNASAAAGVFLADFEAGEGYLAGPLDGQHGWLSTGPDPARVTAEVARSGQRSLLLPATAGNINAAQLTLEPVDAGHPVLFYDFWAKPAAATDPALASQIFLGTTQFLTLVGEGPQAEVRALGSGNGYLEQWLSGLKVPLAPDGSTADWLRLTFRQDFSLGKWDVYVDGQPALFDLPAGAGGNPQLNFLSHQSVATYYDSLLVAYENPLFDDADRDGMSDAWEAAHGLDPTRNDRDGDPDADGLANIQEYVLGTDPHNPDTDGDGLPDGTERALGTNPRSTDSDGDGLPDNWEVGYGLDPLSATDAAIDSDGDGLTNAQEFSAGSDPTDPLNGVLPQITSLVAADGTLGPGNTLSVRVTDNAGRPLPNVPVKFTSTSGGHRLAADPDGPAGSSVTVHSGSDGVATVYARKRIVSGGE